VGHGAGAQILFAFHGAEGARVHGLINTNFAQFKEFALPGEYRLARADSSWIVAPVSGFGLRFVRIINSQRSTRSGCPIPIGNLVLCGPNVLD
jgi:hypothetical protein